MRGSEKSSQTYQKQLLLELLLSKMEFIVIGGGQGSHCGDSADDRKSKCLSSHSRVGIPVFPLENAKSPPPRPENPGKLLKNYNPRPVLKITEKRLRITKHYKLSNFGVIFFGGYSWAILRGGILYSLRGS